MLKHTPLYALHAALGAKTAGFAGYDMPLYYEGGVLKEHLHVREKAGLFDVSHMGQMLLSGNGVAAFLERATPSAFRTLAEGKARYTVLTNEQGGVVDDLIVSRLADGRFFAVVNAGCKEKDVLHLERMLPAGVHLELTEERALIALQGPAAETALQETLGIRTADMAYMQMRETALPGSGASLLIGRLGYTGEDGFELSVPAERAEDVWRMLSAHRAVAPIGLAARDSLRLEMGYPLYGHDIDDATSPIEADLAWVVRKDAGGFPGCDRILREREQGAARKRVGVALRGEGVAREGADVVSATGEIVGRLTSGGFSPSLKRSIGLAYVASAHAAPTAPVFVRIRGKDVPAEICATPFLAPRVKASIHFKPASTS